MMILPAVPEIDSAAALSLRPWRPGDLPALVEAHRDPELRRWLTTTLADEAQARQWLDAQAAGWAAGTRFSFAVVAGGDAGTPIGHVAVNATDGGAAEVGYWTAAPARGRGVATRALEAVSRWALETVAVIRLDLFHTVGNEASCRVAVTCGYVLRDRLPSAPPAFPAPGHRHVRTPGVA